MQDFQQKYYPTTLEAIHLMVLYLFLQTLIDFPLAMYDYEHDTNLLSNPWISFITGVSITAFIFIYGYRKAHNTFKEVFALKMFNPLIIIPIAILFPGIQYFVGFLNVLVEKVIPSPPWFWELFEKIFDNRFGFWGSFLKVAVVAPIIEETLFRGIIMHGLMRNYKKWYAILLSGILFSIFHLNPWQMTYTFFLGLFLGWLMIRTRSLPLCIIAHSINNIIVLLSITWNDKIQSSFISKLGTTESVLLSMGAIVTGILLVVLFSRSSNKRIVPIA
jgi:membrane protease YdiL (CAAX protease family)